MIWNGFDWSCTADAEIRGVRARHAARLAQERARIAQDRQAVLDRVIVARREERAQASRGHALVRELVEP